MKLLSRIVKSVAVVDGRERKRKTLAEEIEASLDKMPVLKQQIFSYSRNPYLDETLALPDKQGYLDELNRMKLEIAEAKAELRAIRRETDEAIEDEARKELERQAEDLSEQEAREEAKKLLAEARDEAGGMLEAARAEAEALKEQSASKGYLEGFDKGFAEAMQEFKAKNEPKARQLEALLEEVSGYREDMIATNESDLLDVVFAVTEKIVGREIKADPRAVASMLYKTLDDNRREENLRITISPDLMPVEAKVAADVKKLITSVAKDALIYIEKDLDEGTCIVETDKGITDLSVDTQLENAKKLLQGE